MAFFNTFMCEFLRDPFFNPGTSFMGPSPRNSFFGNSATQHMTLPQLPVRVPSKSTFPQQNEIRSNNPLVSQRHAPDGRGEPEGFNYFLPLEDAPRVKPARLRPSRSSEMKPTIPKRMENNPAGSDAILSRPSTTVGQNGGSQRNARMRRRDPELQPAVTASDASVLSSRHLPVYEAPNSARQDRSISTIYQRAENMFPKSDLISKIKVQDTERNVRPHSWDPVMSKQLEREIVSRDLNVKWDEIAGLQNSKTILQESMILPALIPGFFKGIRKPCKGILMVGPPGTGKTMLAKAVASECGSTFFNVSSSVLTCKYHGDSEKIVRLLFEMAKFYAPSTIFIDEVDALCSVRGAASEHEASRRFKSELLIHMDGLEAERQEEGKYVMVLAATNHPWDIDEAFRRRFEKRIYVPLPDQSTRCQLLGLCLKSLVVENDVDIPGIAEKLDGYSGADITNVCRNAALMSVRREITARTTAEIKNIKREDVDLPVSAKDFKKAIANCKASVSKKDVDKYEKWMNKYGSC